MDEEVELLIGNNTYTLINLPAGRNIIAGRWVYALKPRGYEQNGVMAIYLWFEKKWQKLECVA